MPPKEKKPIVKRAPKTLKEKRFVKEYLATGNGVQSALKAYDTTNYSSANVIAQENLQKLSMEDYFIAAGLTKEVMAQNTARIALTAKKQNNFTGEVDDDYAIQIKAMEFGAKLTSWFEPPRAAVDEKGETVRPIYGGMSTSEDGV